MGVDEGLGAEITQSAMGSFGVVLASLVLDHYSCFVEIEQHLPEEALVAETAVEALDVGVLPGASRLDVDSLDLVPSEPLLDLVSDEFGAVVTAQIGRDPIGGHRLPEDPQHLVAGNLGS